jgi:hypothetical protein
MKTTKITLITALIVLGAMLFGQADKGHYIYVDNTEKSSRFENLVNKFRSKTERTERDGYKEPVVYMSYTMHQPDVVYEENYGAEAWMTSPFECGVAEADLDVEDWMASPFESKYADAELAVENWMTSPFESSYAEVDLEIEMWMTRPFEAADHIEIESWMTAAF